MAEPRIITAEQFRNSAFGNAASNVTDLDPVIAQAEAACERYVDGPIASTEYTEVLRPSTETVFLRRRPLISVTSVRTRVDHHDDWADFDLTHVRIEHEAGYLASISGTLAGFEVQVTYNAGYEPIPADIERAIISQTALYLQLDLEFFGVSDGEEPGTRYVQKQVHSLLDPYKNRVFFA